jgi:dolichyl-diphosphooligosaccharide--protein glycosyltransferase
LTAPSIRAGIVTGIALGLYLLAWGSGAFFVAILGVWLVLCVPLTRTAAPLVGAASISAIAALVALALVVAFQDPHMHRYGSQVVALVGLAALALAVVGVARLVRHQPRKGVVAAAVVAVALVVVAGVMLLARGVFAQVMLDITRLAPDPARMNVLEARPLFLYSGQWRWSQAWLFFRTGFFIGAIALFPFAARVWRDRRTVDLLILVFTAAVFVATFGQNRFGYYLVTACAVMGGWLATVLLDWGGVPHAGDPTPAKRSRIPLAREVAVIAVAGAMFAPNLSPEVLLAERTNSFAAYWRDTMMWLRHQTPAPFLQSAGRGDEFYFARYDPVSVPAPDYSVMNWWDQGYWVTQSARRVPVANPTQQRAPVSARFYIETDESRALALLAAERSRFVLSDWELPFRQQPDETIMGRFQSVLEWAGGIHQQYYEIVYRREGRRWTPVWVFHAPYYRSMAFRLSVLGGAAAIPVNATSVITVTDHVDGGGRPFRELLSEQTYASYEAAQQAAARTNATTLIVGLDPWQSAFPVDALRSLVEVHAARTPEQKPGEAPWVRIFEVR